MGVGRVARSSKRSKKGLLNNPLILVLILLVFAVAAASQFGLLDKLFGAPADTGVSPPKPATPAASVPPGQAAGQASASQAAATGSEAGQTSHASGNRTDTQAAPPQAPQAVIPTAAGSAQVAAAASKASEPTKPKYQVPDFAFDVGRDNPFLSFPGDPSRKDATTPSSVQPVAAKKPPVETNGALKTQPIKPSSHSVGESPEQAWRYLGTNPYGPVRYAIIETPSTSYIVKVGDRIEGVWLVTEITRERVVLTGAKRTLTLVLGGEKK